MCTGRAKRRSSSATKLAHGPGQRPLAAVGIIRAAHDRGAPGRVRAPRARWRPSPDLRRRRAPPGAAPRRASACRREAMPIRLSPKSKARTVCGRVMPGRCAYAWPASGLRRSTSMPSSRQAPAQRCSNGRSNTTLRVHRHGGPGVVLQLALELAGFPAGVAEGDERVRGALAARHGGQHVARGGDLDVVGDLVGVIPLAAGTVQHEAAVGVHRAAAQHRLLGDAAVGGLELHLRQHVGQLHRQGLVEHDAERALVGVLADDAPPSARNWDPPGSAWRSGDGWSGCRCRRRRMRGRRRSPHPGGRRLPSRACRPCRQYGHAGAESQGTVDTAPPRHAAADELPFVGKAQHAVLAGQLGRKRIEGTRELQDCERRLVEFGVAARAADDGLVELPSARMPTSTTGARSAPATLAAVG